MMRDPLEALLTTTAQTQRKFTKEELAMLNLIHKEEKRLKARENYQDFLEYMRPHPQHYDDYTQTAYVSKPIHKLMVSFWEDVEDYTIMRGAMSVPPQTGKPVFEEELVLMGDGSRKKLKDVVVGDFVITKLGRARRVSEVHEQGELDCVVIKTQSGKHVTAAMDHPMLTPSGWVNAGDIKPRMSLMNVMPEFPQHSTPTEKEICAARLAGYYVGDGSCGEYDNGAGSMSMNATITVVDDICLDDIKKCAEVLGFEWKVTTCGRKARNINLSGGVRSWLREIGLAGKISQTKRVPDFIFTSHKDAVAAFLGAYFACDGTVSKKGLGRHGLERPDTAVEFYSVSEGLLSDTQHLLLRFGIKATIEVKKGKYQDNPHYSWRLRVSSQDHASRFKDNIPVHHAKGVKLRESEMYRTQADHIHLPDMVKEVVIGVRRKCRCLSVEEDKSFLANDYAVHNTTHTSEDGTAWMFGRNPDLHIAIGTYNETRAKEIGDNLRAILTSERYLEVFPEVKLALGGKNKSHLVSEKRGDIRLVGRGSGITGRPVDVFIIDDPVKDKAEAQSSAALDECWKWFSTTCMQRAHNLTRYVVIHTRWAANDLIGRLCDPDHPDYDADIARGYVYLNVKAYNNEPHIAKLLGIPAEECIWPEKFSPQLLKGIQRIMSPEDFSALYMGKPVPDEGGFFQKNMIIPYEERDRPHRDRLKIYAASDHALSIKRQGNYSVLVIAGVDDHGHIWLLDLIRRKMTSDQLVEQMVKLMEYWRPITWWAAKDQISGSIGPFLKRQMKEKGLFSTHLVDSKEIGDKVAKAQPIRAMMSLGLVHFPAKAVWYQDLVNELLRFRGQGDAQDDQVDAIAHLGRGLETMVRARKVVANDEKSVKVGTLAWVMAETAQKRAQEARIKGRAGW